MGCDIHWYLEIRRNGIWQATLDHFGETLNFPNGYRDYDWFSFLQNIRGDCDFGFKENIRIPTDLSQDLKEVLKVWESDSHSHGYYTKADFINKLCDMRFLRADSLITQNSDLFYINHCVTRLEETISNLCENVPDEDQRIVFFFDN